jgi:hypothetical protein
VNTRPVLTMLALAAAAGGVALAQPSGQPGQPKSAPPAKSPAATQPTKPAAPAAPAKPTDKPGAAQPGQGMPSPEEMKQLQQAMEDAAKPGPEHEALAKRVGEWTTSTRFDMGGGAPPMSSAGTAKISMILGGRFQVEDAEGTMMGQPFTSHKMLGYNKASKKYEGVWTYTMNTSMMMLSGTPTEGGKVVQYDATVTEAPGAPERLWITATSIDDDHFTVKLSMQSPDGKEGEPGGVMETTYTRKK